MVFPSGVIAISDAPWLRGIGVPGVPVAVLIGVRVAGLTMNGVNGVVPMLPAAAYAVFPSGLNTIPSTIGRLAEVTRIGCPAVLLAVLTGTMEPENLEPMLQVK